MLWMVPPRRVTFPPGSFGRSGAGRTPEPRVGLAVGVNGLELAELPSARSDIKSEGEFCAQANPTRISETTDQRNTYHLHIEHKPWMLRALAEVARTLQRIEKKDLGLRCPDCDFRILMSRGKL